MTQYKPADTADDGQTAASFLPLQNPTLISGEHGYWPDKEEPSEPSVVTSKSPGAEVKRDEEPSHSEDTRSLDIVSTEPMSSSSLEIYYPVCKIETKAGKSLDLDVLSKPVLYLYPEAETEVTVRLEYQGKLTCTYQYWD